jgi:hypothetical protein
MMEHRVFYDKDHGVMRVAFVGEVNAKSYIAVVERVNAFPEAERMRTLVDLTQTTAPSWDRATRQALADHSVDTPGSKMAVFGASPLVRIVAKMMVVALGQTDTTRFFASESDALKWLAE